MALDRLRVLLNIILLIQRLKDGAAKQLANTTLLSVDLS